MAEVLFYHLTATPLDRTLPDLLEKSLARGWRVLLRCGTQDGLAALDRALWSYRDDSFLPHGPATTADPERQPVLLTLGAENANAAEVLMLVEGATATVAEMSGFLRVCLLFDGGDAAAVEAARARWREVTAAGLAAVYWAQEDARWVRKAASGG
ncbi:MAG TPA: DNA polymerase III subunit chi [Amaricoccus sp.]|uniref:DNA polymerase III subunit chi n=1 Tax=Amaricoccus sp. TaxID=1872485 RepID=UPI001DADAC07|nr:DNA polymerase III subunit chi [Amaricoccus sp.]MCB1373992.1 DNA polymerase III subunit chi [Paracoccaceae bacterium]HPG22150.1 DNA polymerase III subunit chi [Amaricoccus sp.]HRW15553.1 DNA polymerase III subunit chi [Amaricoccus sp.]